MNKLVRANLKDHALHQPRGVALIVGLIFLIILSLFVLGSLRDVLMQERMSGSFRNQSLAESAVESLLRNGEARIFSSVVAANGVTEFPEFKAFDLEDGGSDASVREFRTGVGYPTDMTAALSSLAIGEQFENATDLTSKLSTSGAYVVEGPIKVGDNDMVESHTSSSKGGALWMYRVTARATGGSNDYVRAAETYYLVSRL